MLQNTPLLSLNKQQLLQREADLHKKISPVKKEVMSIVKDENPVMWWAIKHHRNTRGEEMKFDNLHYLAGLYNAIDHSPRMCVEKAVQTGLSELFIIRSHYEAATLGISVMYVLPKYELRNRFVNNRIMRIHKRIPYYNMLVKEAGGTHRVSLIHVGKGTIAYVGLNVEDEFIEFPADSIFVDEKDRCHQANLLLLPDRISASLDYGYYREISNPTIEGFGIDESFLESSQGYWHIQCPSCKKWINPDFFRHVVRQVGELSYEARDTEMRGPICECGRRLERLSIGEWVHKRPDLVIKGFRVSKVFSKFTPLVDLIDKWQKAQGNQLKTQIFYNSDLGRPFVSEGSKLDRALLQKHRRAYMWPVQQVVSSNMRLMGVDVGAVLHVVMRERLPSKHLQLVTSVILPGFAQLGQLIREWKPKRVVIDSLPEIHKVMELKDEFDCVYSSKFQSDLIKISLDKKSRTISMDRTALLDYVLEGYLKGLYINPMEAEHIERGDFYDQLTASTRILVPNEENPEKSRYVWMSKGADHFFLAEAYCMQAHMLQPEYDVFDFFGEATGHIDRILERQVEGDSARSPKEMVRLGQVRQEAFLGELQVKYQKQHDPLKQQVDERVIAFAAEDMLRSQSYVDVKMVSVLTKESEIAISKVLSALGYKESKIKGQYIK